MKFGPLHCLAGKGFCDYLLTAVFLKGGNLFLTVDSKRLGNNQLYQGTLSIDPLSNRMQEEPWNIENNG